VATLLLVHAHPDDETVFTGGVVLLAADAGHRVVLVTCTRGEESEVGSLGAASGTSVAEVRTAELERACALLGVARLAFLGYRDSGMAGSAANQHPDAFCQVPLPEAARRLARLLEQERPEVVVTYTAHGTYGHPDHVSAHHVTLAALDLLPAWRPAVYLHGIPASLLGRRTAARFGVPDAEITTVVEVGDLLDRKRAAFAAHASQHASADPFQTPFGRVVNQVFSRETYVLARGAPRQPHLGRGLLPPVPGRPPR
jgi:LmbE family N-acetylglucosaminyl deacetylase